MFAPVGHLCQLFKVLNSWRNRLFPSRPVPHTIPVFTACLQNLFRSSGSGWRNIGTGSGWSFRAPALSGSLSGRIQWFRRGDFGPPMGRPLPWERALVPGQPMRAELLTEGPRLEQRCLFGWGATSSDGCLTQNSVWSLRGDIILSHSSFFLFYSTNFMGRMSMFQHCPSTLRLCRENSLIYQRFYCTRLPRKSLNSAHNVCVPIEYSQRYAEAI